MPRRIATFEEKVTGSTACETCVKKLGEDVRTIFERIELLECVFVFVDFRSIAAAAARVDTNL